MSKTMTDPSAVMNALLLTDAGNDNAKLEAEIASWTDDQRAKAYEWAVLSHINASDNDDVEVPSCPPHVEKLR